MKKTNKKNDEKPQKKTLAKIEELKTSYSPYGVKRTVIPKEFDNKALAAYYKNRETHSKSMINIKDETTKNALKKDQSLYDALIKSIL